MRYGVRKRLKTGVRLKIFPTWYCNLGCSYCGNKLGREYGPNNNAYVGVKTSQEWIKYLSNFPLKIKEINFSGGEPTFLKGFSNLCNWILGRKYLLMIYTNLTYISPLLSIKESDKLLIYTTYHKGFDADCYASHYAKVKIKHRIVVNEIEKKTLEITDQVTPFGCTVATAKIVNKNYLFIAPDGAIYRNCYDVVESGIK